MQELSINYSFFIRSVKEWNNLPQYVVEAEPFRLFITRFKSFLNICLEFLKMVLKNCISAFSGRLFIARDSKGDDLKIKRKVSRFCFLSALVYLPFIAVLSLFFSFYVARRRP